MSALHFPLPTAVSIRKERFGVRILPLLPLALALVPLLLGGCAHTESGEERELAKMREELTRIQTAHDALDKRVDMLELHGGATAAADSEPNANPSVRSAASNDASTVAMPKLRVVHLDSAGNSVDQEQEARDENADPNDPGARPSLQVFGTDSPRNAHAAHPAGSVSQGSNRGRESGASAFDPQAKKDYDAALALVFAHKYDEGLDALAAFLVKWPDHPNAGNATYWRGECFYAKGDYAHAAEQFEGTIARFPFHNKVPDALLKLGTTYEKLGDSNRSTAALDRLKRDYPRSEAAKKLSGTSGDPKRPEKQGAP